MLGAMAAFNRSTGASAYPSVAIASVMLWAFREGRDRLQEHPAVFHDQQQTQHEEHVVGAKKDMADTLHDKRSHDLQTVLSCGDLDPGLRGMDDVGPASPDSTRNCIFYAMRRFTISSSLSKPMARPSR
jgi:hypothetical protein